MPFHRQRQPDDPELQWVQDLADDLISVLWHIVSAMAGILWWAVRSCFKI